MKTFFLIISPGFEHLAKKELLRKSSLKENELTLVNGGLSFLAPLEEGLALNTILKIPTKILLRIEEFKCRDLPKLFNKFKKIPWANYLSSSEVTFHTSAKTSRLIHTKKIEQTALSALQDFFKANPPKKIHVQRAALAAPPELYLRLEDDMCQVSVNTSGEPLYKRGKNKLIGTAPLRENIAAALALALSYHQKSKLLIDPMCGSGTLCAEAQSFESKLQRDFSYLYFPCFKRTFHYPEQKALPYENFLAFDKDPQMIKICQKNYPELKAKEADLFNTTRKEADFLINPPYNKRLKTGQKSFYKEIVQILKDPSNTVGIIIPNDAKSQLDQFKIKETLDFRNGGLPVSFIIL